MKAAHPAVAMGVRAVVLMQTLQKQWKPMEMHARTPCGNGCRCDYVPSKIKKETIEINENLLLI